MTKVYDYDMVKKKETDKWGLLYEFSVEPEHGDNTCWTGPCGKFSRLPDEADISTCNKEVLKNCVEPWMRSIVEIGVSRDGWEKSSSKVLIENKHKDCKYFGIDLGDRQFIKDKDPNAYIIQANSWDVDQNIEEMKKVGIEQIDLIFIDGLHSVNSLLKEWDYTKILSANGVIALHDTNFHAGPWCIMEFADPEIFDKSWECATINDFGIGVLRRKK